MHQRWLHFSIAVVDDCADLRELMAEGLRAFAFRVFPCSEADAAFDCVRCGMVDALVVRVGSLGRLEDGVLLVAWCALRSQRPAFPFCC